MLKKVGMIVAVAAAGLVALSPIAFASGPVTEDSSQLNTIEGERNQVGLVNANDNNANIPVQACGNVAANSSAAAAAGNAVTGLLGDSSLTNEAGDAASAADCEQAASAGEETVQLNER